MEKIFYSTMLIGDILSEYPGAGDIFKIYEIDFCCGGNRPLIEAIKEQGLNEKEIMNKINENYKLSIMKTTPKLWKDVSSEELIKHIIDTHHNYLYNELPNIGELIEKIIRAHGDNHKELYQVQELFTALAKELLAHLPKEEEEIFPLILKGEEKEQIKNKINELENEHEGAGIILKELRKVTNGYSIPSDVCLTFEMTYRKLVNLENDIFQHIHLENNILFKRY